MNDASDFLRNNSMGPKLPGVSFQHRPDGFTIRGKIVAPPRKITIKNDKNEDEDRLVIELKLTAPIDTTMKNEAGVNEPVTTDHVALWVKRGGLATAIFEATKKVGADLAENGDLAVQKTGTKPSKFPQPQILYAAEYVPPAPTGVGVSSLFGGAS